MIGQKKLITEVERIKADFPRFSIIAGTEGSGKKLFAKHIAKTIGAQFVTCEISVAEVRDIITASYKQKEPIVYLLPDTDKMSIAAKNALLKVTEEPPRQAYFIMTLEAVSNTLNTLTSRGTVFRMEQYTPTDLLLYLGGKYDITALGQDAHDIVNICTVPGDINKLDDFIANADFQEYVAYADLVIENVGRAAGSNAFKIGTKLSFKKEDGLWDLGMFLRLIRTLCVRKLEESENLLYANYITVTSNTLKELSIKGIHKQSTFDMWILNMRQAWRVS